MFPRKPRTDGELLTASIWAVGAQIAGFLLFDVLVIRELPECDMEVGARKEIPALPG